MDVRTKLSERRKELGLTLADVAAKVGVSEATVSRWESGHIDNMKRDKIALLAKALQVSPLFVMGMEDEAETNPLYSKNAFDKAKDSNASEKQGYYLDPKTAQIAQEIFENKDLGLLFDASRKLQPDELLSVKNLVETMVRKERGEND